MRCIFSASALSLLESAVTSKDLGLLEKTCDQHPMPGAVPTPIPHLRLSPRGTTHGATHIADLRS